MLLSNLLHKVPKLPKIRRHAHLGTIVGTVRLPRPPPQLLTRTSLGPVEVTSVDRQGAGKVIRSPHRESSITASSALALSSHDGQPKSPVPVRPFRDYSHNKIRRPKHEVPVLSPSPRPSKKRYDASWEDEMNAVRYARQQFRKRGTSKTLMNRAASRPIWVLSDREKRKLSPSSPSQLATPSAMNPADTNSESGKPLTYPNEMEDVLSTPPSSPSLDEAVVGEIFETMPAPATPLPVPTQPFTIPIPSPSFNSNLVTQLPSAKQAKVSEEKVPPSAEIFLDELVEATDKMSVSSTNPAKDELTEAMTKLSIPTAASSKDEEFKIPGLCYTESPSESTIISSSSEPTVEPLSEPTAESLAPSKPIITLPSKPAAKSSTMPTHLTQGQPFVINGTLSEAERADIIDSTLSTPVPVSVTQNSSQEQPSPVTNIASLTQIDRSVAPPYCPSSLKTPPKASPKKLSQGQPVRITGQISDADLTAIKVPTPSQATTKPASNPSTEPGRNQLTRERPFGQDGMISHTDLAGMMASKCSMQPHEADKAHITPALSANIKNGDSDDSSPQRSAVTGRPSSETENACLNSETRSVPINQKSDTPTLVAQPPIPKPEPTSVQCSSETRSSAPTPTSIEARCKSGDPSECTTPIIGKRSRGETQQEKAIKDPKFVPNKKAQNPIKSNKSFAANKPSSKSSRVTSDSISSKSLAELTRPPKKEDFEEDTRTFANSIPIIEQLLAKAWFERNQGDCFAKLSIKDESDQKKSGNKSATSCNTMTRQEKLQQRQRRRVT